MTSMTFQRIEDRPINIVTMTVFLEEGCSFDLGEYSLEMTGLIGSLSLSNKFGSGDMDLIKERVEEDLLEHGLEPGRPLLITLEESGEWEDVHWHKYYKVTRRVYFN